MLPRSDDDLDAVITRCARGEIAPNMAVMHAFLRSSTMPDAEALFASAAVLFESRGERAQARRVRAAQALARAHASRFAAVKSIAAGAAHDAALGGSADAVASWAQSFDRAAAICPAAGVALYSLGDRALLARATAEVIAFLRREGLLARDRAVLEIGCGGGRCLLPMAAEARRVVGVDIAPRMLALARTHCAQARNVSLVRGSGLDLAFLRDACMDLVLAVDSFPYLVLAGVAETHLREIARVLKPRGRCVILNYAYDGSAAPDLASAARDAGLTILRDGEQPFTLWDGRVFLLQRGAGIGKRR